MQIPKFHETFIPILSVLQDGHPISVNELRTRVRGQYYSDLPTELQEQKTQNGAPLILNRIHWGQVYLKQAKMVEQPNRGLIQITNKGKLALQRKSFTLKDLLQDQDFLEKREATQRGKEAEAIDNGDSPQDMIDSGFRSIEERVKTDLLSKLKNTNPYYFQRVVLLLLNKMGYGEFIETPKSGDGGIDGMINQDRLGLEKIYIQAKRYESNKVRELDVRNFIGAMSRDASKGIFVTTSTFDERAIQKARDAGQKIIMIDGPALVDLMIDFGVGVQVKSTYEIKEIDEDFFEDEP